MARTGYMGSSRTFRRFLPRLSHSLLRQSPSQKAAHTQAQTALTVQKQQFEETRAAEERTRLQRECAMIITLRMKFELIERQLNLRLTWVEQIEKHCTKA